MEKSERKEPFTITVDYVRFVAETLENLVKRLKMSHNWQTEQNHFGCSIATCQVQLIDGTNKILSIENGCVVLHDSYFKKTRLTTCEIEEGFENLRKELAKWVVDVEILYPEVLSVIVWNLIDHNDDLSPSLCFLF